MIILTAKWTKEQNSTAKIPHDHSSETTQVVPVQADVSIYGNQILNLEDLSDFRICLILTSKAYRLKLGPQRKVTQVGILLLTGCVPLIELLNLFELSFPQVWVGVIVMPIYSIVKRI